MAGRFVVRSAIDCRRNKVKETEKKEMELNLLAPLFFVPSLAFFAIQLLRRRSGREAARELGWSLPTWRNLGEAALVLLALAGMATVAFRLIPPGALQSEKINTAAYTGWPRNLDSLVLIFLLELLNRALPEEVFFRGWLGGFMVRRLGFWVGNTLQALVFLLPHLLLLTITQALWPITLVQFAAGWLQGWLRWRSESVIPSTIVHTITNVLGALPVLS